MLRLKLLTKTKKRFCLRWIFYRTYSASSNGHGTTVDETEFLKFSAPDLVNSWWDQNSGLTLQSLNRLRVPFIRDGILQTQLIDKSKLNSPCPLQSFKILDIGCGGGILSEPLARLGAEVTGLDPVEENISMAVKHSQRSNTTHKIKYVCSTAEQHLENYTEFYDAVVASEVAEHVADLPTFINSCINLTKETGSIFITTINKTFLSWLLAVKVAENVLNVVPSGTHNWDKFIPPQDMEYLFHSNGCHVRTVHGMLYMPFWKKWRWISDTSVNYALHAVRRRNETFQAK